MRMSVLGLFGRVLGVVAFCFATLNGTEYSLWRLVSDPSIWQDYPFPAAIGVVVWLGMAGFLLWVLWDSLGFVGIAFFTVLTTLVLGWAHSEGWLVLTEFGVWRWVAPGVAGFILGFGLIFSFIYRYLTGRLQVEDADT